MFNYLNTGVHFALAFHNYTLTKYLALKPEAGWLKTSQMYFLTVSEPRVPHQGISRPHSPLEAPSVPWPVPMWLQFLPLSSCVSLLHVSLCLQPPAPLSFTRMPVIGFRAHPRSRMVSPHHTCQDSFRTSSHSQVLGVVPTNLSGGALFSSL